MILYAAKNGNVLFYIRRFCARMLDPRSHCQMHVGRVSVVLPTINRNADSIASSALPTFVFGKTKSHVVYDVYLDHFASYIQTQVLIKIYISLP